MLTTHKKKKLVMPTNFTIILMILVVIIIVSWIPNAADHKLGILDMFYVAIKGFISRADLIVFLLVIGAFLKVTMDSKSLEAGIRRLLAKMKGKEIYFIPLATFIFSLGGTAYGMCEETLAFYPFMMPLLLAAGFDGLTAFMVIMLGSGVGCLAATLDPFALFTAADAIKVSNGTQIAISDGIIWRFIGWVILTGLLIAFITWYASRVKKDKKNSVYGEYYDEHLQKFVKTGEIPELTRKRKWVIGIFITTFVILIFCIIAWDKFGINVFLMLASVLNGNGNTDNNFVYWAHLHGIGGVGQFWDSANGEFINVTAQNASDAAHQIATFSGAFVLHYDYDGTVHYEITDAFKNFLTSHGYQAQLSFDYLSALADTTKSGVYIFGNMIAIGTWYMAEMACLFFISTLIIGFMFWHTERHFVDKFISGSGEMLGISLIVGVSAGIGVALSMSGMLHHIINGLTNGLSHLPKVGIVVVSYFIYLPLSFLISSTSGLANATFPVLGPVANNLGVAPQVITAFVMALGWVNLWSPASGVVPAALGLADVDYAKFFKGAWPILTIMFIVPILLLIIGSYLPMLSN